MELRTATTCIQSVVNWVRQSAGGSLRWKYCSYINFHTPVSGEQRIRARVLNAPIRYIELLRMVKLVPLEMQAALHHHRLRVLS